MWFIAPNGYHRKGTRASQDQFRTALANANMERAVRAVSIERGHDPRRFALLAFGQIFGFVGVLIALPASAVLLVAIRRLQASYVTSKLYTG